MERPRFDLKHFSEEAAKEVARGVLTREEIIEAIDDAITEEENCDAMNMGPHELCEVNAKKYYELLKLNEETGEYAEFYDFMERTMKEKYPDATGLTEWWNRRREAAAQKKMSMEASKALDNMIETSRWFGWHL